MPCINCHPVQQLEFFPLVCCLPFLYITCLATALYPVVFSNTSMALALVACNLISFAILKILTRHRLIFLSSRTGKKKNTISHRKTNLFVGYIGEQTVVKPCTVSNIFGNQTKGQKQFISPKKAVNYRMRKGIPFLNVCAFELSSFRNNI